MAKNQLHRTKNFIWLLDILHSSSKFNVKLGILNFEVKAVDTFIGTKNCKL